MSLADELAFKMADVLDSGGTIAEMRAEIAKLKAERDQAHLECSKAIDALHLAVASGLRELRKLRALHDGALELSNQACARIAEIEVELDAAVAELASWRAISGADSAQQLADEVEYHIKRRAL